MKKLLALSAAAALVGIQSASAVPTLTLSDSAGNSVTVQDTFNTGVITYNGALGNWNINVTTGIADPPGPGHTLSQPYLHLNSVDQFTATHTYTGGDHIGDVLTITFSDDGLGPINGSLKEDVGGTLSGLSSATFGATGVANQTTSSAAFAFTKTGGVSLGANSTLTVVGVLTANGQNSGTASFDSQISVPDAGMTLAMLGFGLTGVALFARSRKIA